MTRRADIPEDSHRLIDLLAKAASALIIEQLHQADMIIHQNATNPLQNGGKSSAAKAYEAHLDTSLQDVFTRNPIHQLGLRKALILNIGPFIKPNSQDAATFVPTNNALFPNKLIQHSDLAIAREATAEFANELTRVVQSIVAHDIKWSGDRLSKTFAREQKLHREHYGKSSDDSCCIFRLLEEDYEVPDSLGKVYIANFRFKCCICDALHEIRIIR